MAGFYGLKEATTLEKPSGAVQRLRATSRRSENVRRAWALSHLAFSRGKGFQGKTLTLLARPTRAWKRVSGWAAEGWWGGRESIVVLATCSLCMDS